MHHITVYNEIVFGRRKKIVTWRWCFLKAKSVRNVQKYLMARHGSDVNSDVYHAKFKCIVLINSIFGWLVICHHGLGAQGRSRPSWLTRRILDGFWATTASGGVQSRRWLKMYHGCCSWAPAALSQTGCWQNYVLTPANSITLLKCTIKSLVLIEGRGPVLDQ